MLICAVSASSLCFPHRKKKKKKDVRDASALQSPAKVGEAEKSGFSGWPNATNAVSERVRELETRMDQANVDIRMADEDIRMANAEISKAIERGYGLWAEVAQAEKAGDSSAAVLRENAEASNADKQHWIRSVERFVAEKESLMRRVNICEVDLERYRKELEEAKKQDRASSDVEKPEKEESPTNKAMENTVKRLLVYFQKLMKNPERINLNMPCHVDPVERSWVLSGREKAVASIIDVMRNRLLRRERLKGELENDRFNFPVMVCCGLSGLGKTRMLEEWDLYFDGAGVPGPRVAVLILYENGHGVRSLDATIGWEASMAWRFLHRVFLEHNCVGDLSFNEWFKKHLPSNAKDLTLRMAILTLRAAMKIPEEQPLSVFLGIDEYQKIRDLNVALECLVGVSRFCPGCEVYVMMAGLEWGSLASSNASTKRIPMGFLAPRDAEKCFGAHGEILSNDFVRRHVFELGGVPRFITQYAEKVLSLEHHSKANCDKVFNDVVGEFLERAWSFSSDSDRIRLVAFALSGKKVELGGNPGISVEIGEKSVSLKWRQMADLGFCLIQDGNVHVSYWLVRFVRECSGVSVVEEAFVESIQWLCDEVDSYVFGLDAWQSWERFGACFHALRINVLLVVEKKTSLVVPLEKLFVGSRNLLSKVKVVLIPMTVVRVEEQHGVELPQMVTKVENYREEVDWTKGGVVCVNGSGGKGVDIFFALQRSDGKGTIVVVDQRKRVGTKSVSDKGLCAMVESARVVPECLAGSRVDVVVCVFHLFASSVGELESNCVVVSGDELEKYHGCMALHPASDPRVFVNRDNQSTLACLRGIGPVAAKKIIERRKEAKFASKEEFLDFLQNACKVELEEGEETRVFI